MAGKYLSWTIEGEKQLSRRLLVMSEKIKDWEPAFKDTAGQLKEIFATSVFETEGGVIGQRWAPLSKAYAYKKAKEHPGKGILEATGTMKRSFWAIATADMAMIGNDTEYFKYHQSNKTRRSKLPRRVMMKLGKKQREVVVKIFQSHFSKIVNG